MEKDPGRKEKSGSKAPCSPLAGKKVEHGFYSILVVWETGYKRGKCSKFELSTKFFVIFRTYFTAVNTKSRDTTCTNGAHANNIFSALCNNHRVQSKDLHNVFLPVWRSDGGMVDEIGPNTVLWGKRGILSSTRTHLGAADVNIWPVITHMMLVPSQQVTLCAPWLVEEVHQWIKSEKAGTNDDTFYTGFCGEKRPSCWSVLDQFNLYHFTCSWHRPSHVLCHVESVHHDEVPHSTPE